MTPQLPPQHSGDQLVNHLEFGGDGFLCHAAFSHLENPGYVGLGQFALINGAASTETLSSKCARSVAIVMQGVRRSRHYFQVLWAIIVPDAVDMVSVFIGRQIATYLCLQHQNCSLNRAHRIRIPTSRCCSGMPFWGSDEYVSVRMFPYAAFPATVMGSVSRWLVQPVPIEATTPSAVDPVADMATASTSTQRRWSGWFTPLRHWSIMSQNWRFCWRFLYFGKVWR